MAASANTKSKYHPYVSVVCVTYNRRPFLPTFFECMRAQTYPRKRFEIVVVDDGTDCVRDVVEKHGHGLTVRYHRVEQKMALGAKRNLSHTLVDNKAKYIVAADDDDYHCRERIAHSVEMLEKTPDAMIAGSSILYIYFKHIQQMYQFGPYAVNRPDGSVSDRFSPRNTHSTNGCFAYRRELADQRQYSPTACLAEERAFLAEYTIPMVQLDPTKTILVVSHEHNTFDKRTLLKEPNQELVKPSPLTVDTFISSPSIRRFFMEEIDGLLETYDPGHPRMKPDVLKQIQEIDAERQKVVEELRQKTAAAGIPTIMVNEPGRPPRSLSPEEIVQLIGQLQAQVDYCTKRSTELETQCERLRSELLQKHGALTEAHRRLSIYESSSSSSILSPASLSPIPAPTPAPAVVSLIIADTGDGVLDVGH